MDIGVVGVSGRMGQTIVRLAENDPELQVVGALERAESDWVGEDLGEMVFGKPNGVQVHSHAVDAFKNVEAIIDFSTPFATLQVSEIAAQIRAVHVIGTTGFTAEELEKLKFAAFHSTIIRSGNMSLGVNLLAKLVEDTASRLGADFDIEIIEAHHRHKVDAPSGTALLLGEAAASGLNLALKDVEVRGRDGITGERKRGEIGFSAIRGGDIIGEHDVLFAGDAERIVLRHIATDRALFAKGAIHAAKWGLGKEPGEYTMKDVLDL